MRWTSSRVRERPRWEGRTPAWAGCLLVAATLLPGTAFSVPAPSHTLVSPAFAQRMAERYGTIEGSPFGKVTRIEIDAEGRPLARTAGFAAHFQQGQWSRFKSEAVDPFLFVRRDRLPAGAKLLDASRGPGGDVWVVTSEGLFRARGARYEPVSFPRAYLTRQRPVNIDATFSSVVVDRNGIAWLGSDAGIHATNGSDYWHVLDRTDGLPHEYVTCLALGPGGELWAGTTEGVCRYTTGGEWQYYWGPRWLPHNRVNAIAVDREGAAWVATDGGVARLHDRRTTLAEKAAHYEGITNARHNRRGFVTGARLKRPGDPSGGVVHEASDNDGLWTAVWVAAQSFKYAVTKDGKARAEARKSMNAMLDLVRLSGYPGFPARAIILRGEEVDGYNPDETVRVPGETDKIWYQSPVDPNVLCKGDTSSDELDGHYFAWSVFYDLVAEEDDKKRVRETVRAVTDNLLKHDLTLVGHTGRKTRWGVYHPKYINEDPSWWEERGLNALSILSYLKVAEQITGDRKYADKARELIDRHHYLLNTVMQKVAEPWHDVNHSDDQMAFMMYYAYLSREQDPDVRRVLIQSLQRSWKIERPEASPFFNFVYGALTGSPCDAEESVMALREWPWELVEWQMRGSHRHDVTVRSHTGESRARGSLTRALPPSERRLMRWNGNPYEADGGTPTGTSEEDGSAWLLPYWMGRYHRLISE